MSTSAAAIQATDKDIGRAVVSLQLAEDRQPWERQDKEPDRLFHFFKIYCEMPAPRTIRGAFLFWREYVCRDKPSAKVGNVDQRWYEWSRIWQWKARAEAWDAWQVETALRRREKERLEAQIQRYELRQRAINETFKMFDAVDPNNNKWIDNFGRLVEASMKLNEDSRKEYGDDAKRIDQNVSVTFADLIKMSGVDGLTVNETAIRDQGFDKQALPQQQAPQQLESGLDEYIDAEFSDVVQPEYEPAYVSDPEVSRAQAPQEIAKKSDVSSTSARDNAEKSKISHAPEADFPGNSGIMGMPGGDFFRERENSANDIGEDLKESVEYLAMTYQPKYGSEEE